MKWYRHSCLSVLVITLASVNSDPVRAQETPSTYRLSGFYLRGGFTSFDRALLLNWDENTEVMVDQSKTMPSFGGGYALFPREFWAGFNVGALYSSTALAPFSLKKFTDPNMAGASTSTLQYKDVKYSLLLFDLDAYLIPSRQVPFAFTLGVIMGGSFQSYSVSGDADAGQTANGAKSMNIFRYGYKVGCKLVPSKWLSLDLEYRPMAAYSSTTTCTCSGATTTTYGPSERLVSAGLSIHF